MITIASLFDFSNLSPRSVRFLTEDLMSSTLRGIYVTTINLKLYRQKFILLCLCMYQSRFGI